MKLRQELAPNIERAEQLYPTVFDLITQFDDAFDNGNQNKMDSIVQKLNELTFKALSKDDLYEYWGYISKEDLAFDISLPSPKRIADITPDEISAIKEINETLFENGEDYFNQLSPTLIKQGTSLVEGLSNYYRELLERNEPTSPDKVIYL